MLRSYLKIAARNILRQKVYSFINIAGLAIGMALCLLIYQYVKLELTYDSFHENKDNIYRIVPSPRAESGEWEYSALSPMPAGPALQADLPEVVRFTRFTNRNTIVAADGKCFKERLLCADPAMLDMFSFPLVSGNMENPLGNEQSVVITEDIAHKYFGAANPVGEFMSIGSGESKQSFMVTAVARNVPENSTIKFDFLIHHGVIEKLYGNLGKSWGARTTRTYVQLMGGVSGGALEEKMPGFLARHLGDLADRIGEMRVYVQPLPQVHLDPRIHHRHEPTTNPFYLYILSAIGLLILVVACINFMNILIGLSLTRIKEIGVRKVIGAGRAMLVKQFLVESVFLSLISLCFAVALAELFLPVFNGLAGSHLVAGDLFDWVTVPVGLILLLAVAFLAGGYPALILSRFSPNAVLSGKQRLCGGSFLTRSLVTAQFALSILFITCLHLMSSQMDYVKNRDLGFDEEQVVVLSVAGGGGDEILNRFKNTLGSHSSIVSIAGGRESLGRESDYGLFSLETEGKESLAFVFRIDENYLSTLGIELVDGRGFSPEYTGDATRSILVNEAFVKEHGWESALGKKVKPGLPGLEDNTGTIVGVVKDYHFLSLHSPVESAILHMAPHFSISKVYVRISPDDVSKTIALLRSTWEQVAPGVPFEHYFLDQDFNVQYREDEKWGRIVRYATVFAVLISAIGLFGVTTLSLSRRTKEIGIRKVLGATVSGIIMKINREFAFLVVIANVLAWPVAYYIMDRWLQTFAFRVDLGWTSFVLAAVLSLGIALATISVQAYRAACTNPVDSLRYE